MLTIVLFFSMAVNYMYASKIADFDNLMNSFSTEIVKDTNVFFIFEPDESYGMVETAIKISMYDKQIVLTTVLGYGKIYDESYYKDMSIPENAVAVCGAWWAGSGEYFYIIKTETGITVFKGWDDESVNEGLHWEKFKDFEK